jgi:hypothetical protein
MEIPTYEEKLLHQKLKSGNIKEVNSFIRKNTEGDNTYKFQSCISNRLLHVRIKRKELLLWADIPQSFGYKLLTKEKNTNKRDYILRICIVLRMTLDEIQEALDAYPMPRLNHLIDRDTIIIVGIKFETSLDTINEWLDDYGYGALDKPKNV